MMLRIFLIIGLWLVSLVGSAQPQTGVDVEGVNIIGNVYGGGNKADVTGNTNVVVGKQAN